MADENPPRVFLMVQDGQVINRVLWDGDFSTWQAPDGVDLVEEGKLPAKTPPMDMGAALDTSSPAISGLVEVAPPEIDAA